ncbi:MAG: hypothetical protein ABIN36_12560 [Ferruginibacter sp.]
MQGIPFFHFKCLREDVEKIHQQSDVLRLPPEHREMIIAHKEKLNSVYDEYEDTLKKLSIIIKEYRDQQIAIRRLMIMHKRYKKLVKSPQKNWKRPGSGFPLEIAK